MPFITFYPDNKKIENIGPETILESARRAEVPITNTCTGNGRCSTCRIQLIEGLEYVSPQSKLERGIAERMRFPEDIRLACQTKISGDVKVRRLVLDEEDIKVTSLLIQEGRTYSVGVEKEVLILFADIRNFTSIAEVLLPYDVVHILNRYFHAMNEIITDRGGTINNYMGDGFLALFDVDKPDDDILHGIEAGLEMLEAVDKIMHPYVKKFFHRDMKIGIGMHYGIVVAGSMGSQPEKKYTIIGDAVNVTSRIEKYNKKLHTSFLISEDVYALAKDKIRIGKKHTIPIRGKTGYHTVYEVVGLNGT